MADIIQLYKKESSDQKSEIYPKTSAEAVETAYGTLAEALQKLQGQIDSNIKLDVDVQYAQTAYNSLDDIRDNEEINWGENFILPTSEYPYTWKRTTLTMSSIDSDTTASNVSYELSSVSSENTQTLYTARSADTKEVKITYNQIQDGDTLKPNYNDTLENILKVNTQWSTKPVAISATNPNGYIATRNRGEDGQWQAFDIVQNAKWAYNSIPVFKYKVTSTSDIPSVIENEKDYSQIEGWSDQITSEFTGYMWMINATIVNDIYQLNGTKVWSSPTLISIVK